MRKYLDRVQACLSTYTTITVMFKHGGESGASSKEHFVYSTNYITIWHASCFLIILTYMVQ
jgi:hypothetical protein